MPDDAQSWPELVVKATGDDTEPVIIVAGDLDASGA
jgi:hypothetical protein